MDLEPRKKRRRMNALCASRSFTLVVALAAAALHAQSGRDEQRLDGSTPAKLEASVVSLQNALSPRRREDFEVALAMIWIQRTTDSADLDTDGILDVDDIRLLEADATALLTAIQRGNLVSAIEQREKAGSELTAAGYFALLDGLGYDEVLALAGRTDLDAAQYDGASDSASSRGYLDGVRRLASQRACTLQSPPPTSRIARRATNECAGTVARIDAATGKALNTAIEALNAQRYADAGRALEDLDLKRLAPYERSKAEQILYSISFGEGHDAAARDHLLLALDAGGLNAQETRAVLDQIRFLETRLPANRR
jgi:hypothetical protein